MKRRGNVPNKSQDGWARFRTRTDNGRTARRADMFGRAYKRRK
jgi:hypothetical protein